LDWNYFYSLLAFLVGLAAGFQGIYERYQKDSLRASVTFPGIFYLLTRGAVPALIFVTLYGYRIIESRLLLQALACGTGAELVLRSRVYVKQEQKDGSIEELLRGPFDLLRWYQNLFLESIADFLAETRKRFVKTNLPEEMDFLALCDRVLSNMGAWPSQQAMTDMETAVNKLNEEFDKEQQKGTSGLELEKKFRLKLGYLILN
jgi:hypothetical protein